ncbi:MAG: hypothetical protein WBP81_34805 [Solirubrobacteraceae bacterium]
MATIVGVPRTGRSSATIVGVPLSEINADYPRYLRELEDGRAILVYSDDRNALLGVLTRDPELFGDARLAQQIEAGHMPPLEQLLEGGSA